MIIEFNQSHQFLVPNPPSSSTWLDAQVDQWSSTGPQCRPSVDDSFARAVCLGPTGALRHVSKSHIKYIAMDRELPGRSSDIPAELGASMKSAQFRDPLARTVGQAHQNVSCEKIVVDTPIWMPVMGAKAQSISDQLHQIADELLTNATWKDVFYEVYFRREAEAGLAEALRGEFATDAEVKAIFAKYGVDLDTEMATSTS